MSGIMNMFVATKTTIATAVDAFFNSVSLLLNTSSTNGAQNNTFLDSSSSPLTITRNGNVTQGTFTPFSQTGWSTNFVRSGTTASNTRLLVASNVGLGLQSNNFCIEVWAYFATSYTTDGPFCANLPVAGFVADTFWFGPHSINSGKVTVYIYNYSSSTYFLTETTAPPINEWVHYALVRSGNTFTIYRNGVSTATGTFSGSVTGATSPLYIARSGDSAAANSSFDGFMSNLRVVNGSSVYTSSFTPQTTPLTSITNTGLLTLQSNRWVDNSTNAAAITVDTGTPSVQAFSPFLPTAAYDAAVVGGSGYFDGSGDYLTFTDSSNALDIGSVNVSCEAWVYSTASVTGGCIVVGKYGGSSTWNSTNGWEWILAVSATNFPNLQYYTSGTSLNTITSSKALALNSWNHLAIATDTSTNISLFLNGERVATTTGTVGKPTTRTSMLVAGPNSNLWTGYLSGMRFLSGSNAYSASSSSITVPTASPTSISGTALLLNYTNAGIFDSAAKNALETVGNAQVSTTQAKWGTTSMAFDGTGDYLITNSQVTPIGFGSGDFTIEFWLYLNSTGTQVIFDGRRTGAADVAPMIYYLSGLKYYTAGNDRITGGTLSTGQWYHIAVCRSGTSTKMFIDGTQTGSTYTDTNSYVQQSQRPTIGAEGVTIGNSPLNAYIDDLRISKYARYTTTFTAPTAALPLQ